MAFPSIFIQRLAIPLVVAGFFFVQLPGQFEFYDRIQLHSDYVLSRVRGEGSGGAPGGEEVYDFIIVGGGSSGAVVANRLSQSGNFSVLLLEAGGDPNPLSDIPFFIHQVLNSSSMEYGYKTVPQQNACLAQPNQSCAFPRGKALGGSSSVNGLVHNRCSRFDYDFWASFTHDEIWRYENLLPTFLALEDYHGSYNGNGSGGHGVGGELYIRNLENLPSLEVLLEALQEKGIPIGDLNTGQVPGFSKVEYNIKNGRRWGTYQAFLEPVLERKNLKIYRYASATKIHFDGTKKAIGVSYTRHGSSYFAGVRNELIISAGAIDSPKLLMLSGIGPTEHLQEIWVTPAIDLPVGNYLDEHPFVIVGPFYLNQTFGVERFQFENIHEYAINQTGPAILTNFFDQELSQLAHGYWSTSMNANLEYPDIRVIVLEKPSANPAGNMSDSLYFTVEIMRPSSQGTVRLSSSNPADHPLIDLNFYQDPSDVRRMIEGIQFMLDVLLNSTAYKRLGIHLDQARTPGCEEHEFMRQDYLECHVRQRTTPGWHPTSTCRMGPNRTVAVVDSRLRVFGTTGLRVVDSSIMPRTPNGNTNVPSILIGQKGAEFILSDWSV